MTSEFHFEGDTMPRAEANRVLAYIGMALLFMMTSMTTENSHWSTASRLPLHGPWLHALKEYEFLMHVPDRSRNSRQERNFAQDEELVREGQKVVGWHFEDTIMPSAGAHKRSNVALQSVITLMTTENSH